MLRPQFCFMTLEYFGIRIFWHRDTSAEMSIALHCAETSMCQNILVPKCPSALQCPNVILMKRPWCQNIPMPKYTCAKISSYRKALLMKCLCQNVFSQNVMYRNGPKPPNFITNFTIKRNVVSKENLFKHEPHWHR